MSVLSQRDRFRLERGQPPVDVPLSNKGEINKIQWMNRDMSITTWQSVDGKSWSGWTEKSLSGEASRG